MRATYADVDGLKDWIGHVPTTDIRVGGKRFVDWHRGYYRVGV